MRYTVFGADGFIGSNFIKHVTALGHDCVPVTRETRVSPDENLGHVIYAIGLTADFRKRPMDTVKAHVTKLIDTLEQVKYESFLYLSSTRVYQNASTTAENDSLIVNPNNFSDLYNISKLMGESVCLAVNNPSVRIVRLSNVIGVDLASENFISALVKEALDNGRIELLSSPQSEKDYIGIEDVVRLMAKIAERGKVRLYNLARGKNVSTAEIIEFIQARFSCSVSVIENAPCFKFEPINTERIQTEFGVSVENPLRHIEELVKAFKHY